MNPITSSSSARVGASAAGRLHESLSRLARRPAGDGGSVNRGPRADAAPGEGPAGQLTLGAATRQVAAGNIAAVVPLQDAPAADAATALAKFHIAAGRDVALAAQTIRRPRAVMNLLQPD